MKIGKHEYEFDSITIREELQAKTVLRDNWAKVEGIDPSLPESEQMACIAYSIKTIDGKKPESPREAFKHVMNLPRKDEAAIRLAFTKLNESADFFTLLVQMANDGIKSDLSSEDTQESATKK